MEDLWLEFQTLREQIRDCRDNAAWYARKRDEARNPKDYVHYAKYCNHTIKEQSDLQYKETALHFKLVALVDEEENSRENYLSPPSSYPCSGPYST